MIMYYTLLTYNGTFPEEAYLYLLVLGQIKSHIPRKAPALCILIYKCILTFLIIVTAYDVRPRVYNLPYVGCTFPVKCVLFYVYSMGKIT